MKRCLNLLGNLLIASAILSTLYIYYPILIEEYKFRSRSETKFSQPESTEFGLVIDKLGINETVSAEVDPFNKAEYMPILQENIAHAMGSSLPNENGHTYLFAHSSDNPFSITRYNTSFYLLDKLEPGDEIKLFYHDKEYRYQVEELRVVKPYQVEELTQVTEHQLTLQTCTPVGTAINRLLVIAHPV